MVVEDSIPNIPMYWVNRHQRQPIISCTAGTTTPTSAMNVVITWHDADHLQASISGGALGSFHGPQRPQQRHCRQYTALRRHHHQPHSILKVTLSTDCVTSYYSSIITTSLFCTIWICLQTFSKAGMAHSVSRCTCGWHIKLWSLVNICHTPSTLETSLLGIKHYVVCKGSYLHVRKIVNDR